MLDWFKKKEVVIEEPVKAPTPEKAEFHRARFKKAMEAEKAKPKSEYREHVYSKHKKWFTYYDHFCNTPKKPE